MNSANSYSGEKELLDMYQISKRTGFTHDFKNHFVTLLSYLSEREENFARALYLGDLKLSELVSTFVPGVYRQHILAMIQKKSHDEKLVDIFLDLIQDKIDDFENAIGEIRRQVLELEKLPASELSYEEKQKIAGSIKDFIGVYIPQGDIPNTDGITKATAQYSEDTLTKVRILLEKF